MSEKTDLEFCAECDFIIAANSPVDKNRMISEAIERLKLSNNLVEAAMRDRRQWQKGMKENAELKEQWYTAIAKIEDMKTWYSNDDYKDLLALVLKEILK